MVYRVYTPEVLDVPADFSIELAIPVQDYPQSNPDGTRPVATLKINASTIKFALSSLLQINEGDHFIDLVAFTLLNDDNFVEIIKADVDAFGVLLKELHEEFLSFTLSTKDEEGNFLEATLTAPSGYIAYRTFMALTSEKKLAGLATSFMPIDHDAEDDYDDYDD